MTVFALAGRRIDAPDAPERRFPPSAETLVAAALRDQFRALNATVLVCAAACGADLIAIETATATGLRVRIVLPTDSATFRAKSVVDRGSSWGERFDRAIVAAVANDDLIVLGHERVDGPAIAHTNEAILDEAHRIAERTGQDLVAIAVWNGTSNRPNDASAAFIRAAAARHLSVIEISSIDGRRLDAG
jgi:hypothetical protein